MDWFQDDGESKPEGLPMSDKRDKATINLIRLTRRLVQGGRLPRLRTAEELKVSERTLQRYISKLLEAGLTVDHEDTEAWGRVFFLSREGKKFRLDIGMQQVVALNVALNWLEQFEGNVLFDSLGKLKAEVVAWLRDAVRAEAEKDTWRSQKVHALPFLPSQLSEPTISRHKK